MPKSLTVQQQKIYNFVSEFTEENGYPPSVREICKGVGLKSTSTVHGHLSRLEKKGFLIRNPSMPRAVIVAETHNKRRGQISVPIVGNVTAGEPILAHEEISGYIGLPLDFAKSDGSFILTVRGESMIDAGILNGDNLIVQPDASIVNGDIVVAMLDESASDDTSATCKRFFKENGKIRLQPENTTMEPIIVDDVRLLGKVVGLLRKF